MRPVKITAITVAAGAVLGLTTSAAVSANSPTATPSPTATASPTATPSPTASPSPTATPSASTSAKPSLRAAAAPRTARTDQTVTLLLRGCRNPKKGGTAEGAPISKGSKERAPIGVTKLAPGQRGSTLVGTAKLTNVKSGGTYDISFFCTSDPKTVVKATLRVK